MTSDRGSFSVILLAGDRASDEIAKVAPRNRKVLLHLLDKPMILHVLEMLDSSERINSIVVVGNRIEEIESYPEVNSWRSSRDHIQFLEGQKSPATSVVATLKTHALKHPILVLTADCPLLNVSTFHTFCDMAVESANVDVVAALAEERAIRSTFPGVRRTFIRLGGTGYSGCNMFALLSEEAIRAAEVWCEVEKKRKRPWQLISFFGWTNLLNALIGRLDLDSAFSSVSRFMSLNARPVVLKDPAAAMDVDRLEHISVAENALISRRGAPAPYVS